MNAIVAQAGGPTPVINASLAAIVRGWQQLGGGRIYGARYGVEGLTKNDWADLSGLDEPTLTTLTQQPAAAPGMTADRPFLRGFTPPLSPPHQGEGDPALPFCHPSPSRTAESGVRITCMNTVTLGSDTKAIGQ